MKFENVPLGYDEKLKQWKVHVCCHTCGAVGELFCFDDEWEYGDYKDEDFPCTKCFWEQEIPKVRNGTTDFEGIEEQLLEDILKRKSISWDRWADLPEEGSEKLRDIARSKMKTMKEFDIKDIIASEMSEGDFFGAPCKI